jgi:putative transposase
MNSLNKNTQELIPGYFYHIYNRGIGDDKIFYNENNYYYFLKKYKEYLSEYVETYAYCLLPNHFHLLIKIKDLEIPSRVLGMESLNASRQFRKFFISYSMSINKQQNRKGSLFIKNFKRKIILKTNYLSEVILYIHNNPVHHKICSNLQSYKWSSYLSFVSNNPTNLPRNEVLELFGGRKEFIEFHSNYLKNVEVENFIIE